MADGIAFVAGGAICLGPDYAAAVELCGEPAAVFAVNHAALYWPGYLHHFVTIHPELVQTWLAKRHALGGNTPRVMWCGPGGRPPKGMLFRRAPNHGGSSGMLAAMAAIEAGFSRVVLCGVPLLPTFRHFDDPRHWSDARRFHRAWERRRDELRPFVRSMSGWTAGLLGSPTAAWCQHAGE